MSKTANTNKATGKAKTASKAKDKATGKVAKTNKKELKPKPTYVVAGSEEETQYLNELKDNIVNVDVSFMDYNASVNQFDNDYDSQMNRMNAMYYRILLGQCVRPLMNGINPTTVMQSVGMYAGAALINKEFRQSCQTMVQQQLYPIADKLPIKWQKKMMLNHELPIGLESAAMMQLSWAKQAYDDMREPGANADDIMTEYNKAIDNLQNRCIKSGIATEDLNKMVRIKVGQLAQKNPAVLTLFNETVYQNVSMDNFHDETHYIQGEHGVEKYVATVWSGEFTDNDKASDKKGQQDMQYTGSFTPRQPCDMTDLLTGYKDLIAGMQKCETVKDLDTFFTDYDVNSDLYERMMVSDGADINKVNDAMGSINKECMTEWLNNHKSQADELKTWAAKWADKVTKQSDARQKAGVSSRKIPTKFEDILQDAAYYDYSMDKIEERGQ